MKDQTVLRVMFLLALFLPLAAGNLNASTEVENIGNGKKGMTSLPLGENSSNNSQGSVDIDTPPSDHLKQHSSDSSSEDTKAETEKEKRRRLMREALDIHSDARRSYYA